MPKQHRVVVDTRFFETTPAGLAAKYLNSGEIKVRDGVATAIACVFAALGGAIHGLSEKEVESIIERSRTQFEIYCALARSRCLLSNKDQELENCQRFNQNQISEEKLIDLDNEDIEDGEF